MDNLQQMQQLWDINCIEQLKATYCRWVDTKQWAQLQTLFMHDAKCEGMGSAPNGASVEVWLKGVSVRLSEVVSVHHCYTPEIIFPSSITARGVWAMTDYLEWPAGSGPHEAPGYRGLISYGYYEEEYVKTENKWKISFMRLTRIRIDPLGADRPATSSLQLMKPQPALLALTSTNS